MENFNLESRLVSFSVNILSIDNQLPNSRAGNHMGRQLVRSGTSSALNYGEAQSAESRRDFVHKMNIGLKELRETMIALKILKQAEMISSRDKGFGCGRCCGCASTGVMAEPAVFSFLAGDVVISSGS